ncbi:MAG: peptide-methionine (S)-S-oxide reductase MsrA [Bacteroidetes bacterium]|nr:peptide-methionine (S)-S-oxide reductase MsrA [Bacteroidota bacterium]
MKSKIFNALMTVLSFSSCAQNQNKEVPKMETQKADTVVKPETSKTKLETATFGAGCFWCVEAQFQMLDGVVKVESGFSGGSVKNPSYKDVCTGSTGHAEVCNITYDPSKISYEEMLFAFWQTHDPTQLNRQGNDVGTQYRSVIFYHNEKQKRLAEEYKKKLNDEKVFDKPVVTEISPFTAFYKAEDYHQNYFNQNGEEPYCQFVVRPKVEKFQKVFKNKLKNQQ